MNIQSEWLWISVGLTTGQRLLEDIKKCCADSVSVSCVMCSEQNWRILSSLIIRLTACRMQQPELGIELNYLDRDDVYTFYYFRTRIQRQHPVFFFLLFSHICHPHLRFVFFLVEQWCMCANAFTCRTHDTRNQHVQCSCPSPMCKYSKSCFVLPSLYSHVHMHICTVHTHNQPSSLFIQCSLGAHIVRRLFKLRSHLWHFLVVQHQH